MRYIEKLASPDFFKEDTKDLNEWNQYKKNKDKFREYILENEQNYLCAYCEVKVNAKNSHLEHIKPKEVYKSLIFDYFNLIVSCNGIECNEKGDNSRHSCGHIKDNYFDEENFLSPTEYRDINEYFKFTANGEIKPTLKDEQKSKYTIDILNLNYENLVKAREKSLKVFRKELQNSKIPLKNALSKLNKNRSFITFLKFHFQKFTKDN